MITKVIVVLCLSLLILEEVRAAPIPLHHREGLEEKTKLGVEKREDEKRFKEQGLMKDWLEEERLQEMKLQDEKELEKERMKEKAKEENDVEKRGIGGEGYGRAGLGRTWQGNKNLRKAVHGKAQLERTGFGNANLGLAGHGRAGLEMQGLEGHGMENQGLKMQGLDRQGSEEQGLKKQSLEVQGMEKRGLEKQSLDRHGSEERGLEKQGQRGQEDSGTQENTYKHVSGVIYNYEELEQQEDEDHKKSFPDDHIKDRGWIQESVSHLTSWVWIGGLIFLIVVVVGICLCYRLLNRYGDNLPIKDMVAQYQGQESRMKMFM